MFYIKKMCEVLSDSRRKLKQNFSLRSFAKTQFFPNSSAYGEIARNSEVRCSKVIFFVPLHLRSSATLAKCLSPQATEHLSWRAQHFKPPFHLLVISPNTFVVRLICGELFYISCSRCFSFICRCRTVKQTHNSILPLPCIPALHLIYGFIWLF